MNKPLAFVIMPFSSAVSSREAYSPMDSHALDTVFSIISKTLARKFEVRRAESPTDILRDIIVDLDRAELVVADLTSLNPNVMYELGIRHGFCKKTIMVTQDRGELPFDIGGYQCIEYKWITDSDRNKFKRELLRVLELMEKHDDPRHGPVHTHLGIKVLGIAHYSYQAAIRKLRALFTELGFVSAGLAMAADSLAQQWPEAVKPRAGQPFPEVDLEALPSEGRAALLNTSRLLGTMSCVDLLIAENYVPSEFDTHKDVTDLIQRLLAVKTFRFHGEKMADNPLEKMFDLVRHCMGKVGQLVIAMEAGIYGEAISEIKYENYPDILSTLRHAVE